MVSYKSSPLKRVVTCALVCALLLWLWYGLTDTVQPTQGDSEPVLLRAPPPTLIERPPSMRKVADEPVAVDSGSAEDPKLVSQEASIESHSLISSLKSKPALQVCVVGSPSAAQEWADALPLATVLSFPGAGGVGGSTSNQRIQSYEGATPRSIRVYFARHLDARCALVVLHAADDDAVAMLRAVSSEPHVILFAEQAATSLTEGHNRRYLSAPETEDKVMAYTLRQFTKTIPLPVAGLAEVLGGSWRSVDLTPLDKLAEGLLADVRKRNPGSLSLLEGHSAQLVSERQVYTALARLPHVSTICEIGFNMGHSASLWLLVNPKATVYMFDLWNHDYSSVAEEYLKSKEAADKHGLVNVASRLVITRGSSLESVPKFVASHPDVKCDIISVDGGHTYELALADIENMMPLANPKFNLLFVDDTSCGSGWCVDAPCYEHERRGNIVNLLRISEHESARGISVFQYNTTNLSK